MNIKPGQTIANRYRVDQFLGRGGMAEVYKIWDTHRNTALAMKVLHEDLAVDRVFMRRFQREAETLAKLQHPNIIRFYGLEQEDRLAFMLLDYVEGENLKPKIFDAKGPYPLPELMNVMRGVCQALAYAHREGLVHNDIKPGNIMINQHGQVLLADFGIARLSDAATATMVGAGTPAYMAPEQVKGLNPVPQTDIYALGVVLYEMITGGERPFTGEHATTTGTTSSRVRWEQVNLEPPSLRLYNPGISPEMETVVLKCLEKAPEHRFKTALDLLNALERATANTGIPAPARKISQPLKGPEIKPVKPGLPIIKGTQKSWYQHWGFWLGLASTAAIVLAIMSGNSTPEVVVETIIETVLVEEVIVETAIVEADVEVVPEPTEPVIEATLEEAAGTPTTVGTSGNPIKMIFVPSVDVEFMIASGDQLEQSLYDLTGLYFKVKVPTSYAATIEEMCDSSDNTIGFLPAMGYTLANEMCGVEPALASERYGYNTYWTAFFVARNSSYQTLEDLNGATWAYPATTSTTGYKMPNALFRDLNIQPGQEINAGSISQAVKAVNYGQADVGTAYYSPPLFPSGSWSMGMDADIPDNLVASCGLTNEGKLYCGEYRVLDARTTISDEAPDVVQKVRILDLSPEIPNDTMSISPDFPDELKDTVIQAVISYVYSAECENTICNENFYDWSAVGPIYDENFDGVRLLREYLGITLENIGD